MLFTSVSEYISAFLSVKLSHYNELRVEREQIANEYLKRITNPLIKLPKIREKAVLATKARLVENHKSFDDYTDEQLEIIIADEERKIVDDLKTKSLVVALAALGLNFFV